MSNTWKRILSLLLAVVMMLSLGVTGFAEDAEEGEASLIWEEGPEEGPEEDPLEPDSYELSPDSLNVPKLGLDEEEDAFADGQGRIALVGEPEEEDTVDLNEVVRVSVFLEDPATLAAGYSARSVNAPAAVSYRNGLRAQQAEMTARIEGVIGHPLKVHWNLTLAANAIATELSLGEMTKVEAIPGVRSVQRENRYYAQEDEPAQPETAHTSENMVGAAAAWNAGYTGAGSRIAIIDTGIDTEHQSFDADAFNYAIAETGKDVELMTDIPGGLNGSGVRISDKIPFAYNYVDGNTDVTHMNDSQGEHGSHVAGIAAANRFIKSGSEYKDAASTVGAVGMAPDAQLLIMKVFGANGGAYDSDYMAAIEDAVVLKADVVNLSLGSASQGFTFSDDYQDILNNLVNGELNEKMVVSISAGNAYDLPYLMDRSEKLLYKEDVSMHTGGSPGSYVNSLCVAAAQNTYTKGRALDFGNGLNVFFYESTGNEEEGTTYSNPAISTIAGNQFDFVYIDAAGEAADYAAVNSALGLSGKVVIVNRGGIAFAEKGNNAKSYNPKAVIVANNQDGTIYMDLSDFTGSFPMVSITQSDAERVKAAAAQTTAGGYTCYTGKVKVTTSDVEVLIDRDQATITDFSSWGIPGSLLMKPEITAPGGDIYSVWGANAGASTPQTGHDQYENMSGTSMAAPHITGLTAVLAQYLRENPVANTALTSDYSTRAIAQSLMMSTATPMRPEGSYLPILQQGAGLADVSRAISAKSVLMMSTTDDNLTVRTGAAADGKVKAELGDDPGRTGEYAFSFTLYNLTDQAQVYTLRTDLFTQAVKNDTYLSKGTTGLDFGVSYSWNGQGTQVESHDVDGDGDTDRDDAQAILDYVSGKLERPKDDAELMAAADLDGDEMLSSQDAYLLLGLLDQAAQGGYVLAANGTADVTVTIELTAAQKEELDQLFRDELGLGGAYIQGYTYVSTGSSTREGERLDTVHSIPILAFYGAWTDATMFDTTSYTQHLYETGNGLEPQEPYAASSETTNYLRLQQNGQNRYFAGNPYMVEESFPADRLAINGSTVLQSFGYNLIRAAGTTGYAVTRLDQEGLVTDVLSSGITGTGVYGMYYSNSNGWMNTTTKTYSLNKTPAALGLQQGERFRVGFYAVPEYNAMLVNNSYDSADSGSLSLTGFNTLLKSNALGKGAYVGFDFVVDNEAPVIVDYSLDGSTLSVTASDNEALAYVAVLSLDGTVRYAEKAPGTDTYTVSFDASDAIENAPGYVAVFVGDYAGNEAARALKVNENAYQTREVYVLTDTVTAGGEYLILNTASAGTGYALSYRLNTAGTTATVQASATPVQAGTDLTGNKPYVESAAATAVWTAGTGSSNGTYTFDNNGWFLRSSNTSNLTITKDTSRRDWTWDGANNRLSINSRYLRYTNSTFSLNSAVNSVYLYQKTTVSTDTPLDPYAVTEVTITPASLDLYKGSSAELTAQVLPMTAEDRSVTWSSSDPSVATVDQTGHVVAVGAGSANIIAAANGDPSKTAACSVKVTSIDKALNAIIWDEDGSIYFSRFNANNVSENGWTALHNKPVGTELTSAFMANASTLYAGTLDNSDASTVLYTVDRNNNYALTEFGNNFVGAFGMARASSRYTDYFVYGYAKYLIFGNLTPQEDEDAGGTLSGLPYGLLDVSETSVGDAYVCAVCAKAVTATSSSFYFLDENGKIWQTTMSIGNSVTFGTPTLVVDTGIGTGLMYQSLYFDGTYLYWSHSDGEQAELIIYNPSTKALYHAGNFGAGVWPAAGLYVDGAAAPASVDDDVMAEPLQLERVASYGDLVTPEVIERLREAYAEYGLVLTLPLPEGEDPEGGELPETPEEPVIEPAEEPTITPAEEPEEPIQIPIEEPVIEPVEEIGSAEPVFGTLQAFRAASTVHVADLDAYTEPEEDTDAKELVIGLGETEQTHNGCISVEYNPELLTFTGFEKADCLSHISVYDDPKKPGIISIAYANKADSGSDFIPADTVFATLRFTTGCTGAEEELDKVWITTLERNGDLELNEATAVDFTGAGHQWGEAVWTWAEDYSSAALTAVCGVCGEVYTANAQITSVTVDAACEQDGKITYTAAALWVDGSTVTDVKEVVLPATGHDWSEVSYEWAADNSSVTATRVCGNDASHVETETAETEVTVTREATCETAGETTYTAAFTNPAFETQTRVLAEPAATGHRWGEPVWTWAEDYSSASVTLTCGRCGETITETAEISVTQEGGTTIYTATAEVDGTVYTDVKIEGCAVVIGKSLSLKGKIAVNFYLDLPENVTSDPDAYVTINDVKYLVSEAEQSEVRAAAGYRFTVSVKFAHLQDEQVLRLYNGRGELLPLLDSEGNDLTETGFVYRAQDYIEYVRANSEDEGLLAVVNALSDLGSLAQAQFKYNVDSRVDVVGDLASVTAEMVKDHELKLTTADGAGIRYYGSSLLLKDDTTVRHYFTLETGEIGDYTFTVDGAELEPAEKGGLYYVDITGIVARDLDKSFHVEVLKGGETVIGLDYSALSYACTTLSRGKTDTLTELAKAVVLYSKAANAYLPE